jgi:hypothetical protein
MTISAKDSAGIFRLFIEMLAEDPSAQHREMASRVMAHAKPYEFTLAELNAGPSLSRLGVAGFAPEATAPTKKK